ncbi:hypothetical protein [Ectothiorhodospira shaposhnikovii]|uniref:hypothetical protein n=1 Tax=Ectothiorhodospira shaposhnikovii TaxID=1054 RepID=UPI001EE91575|nr:hypothetical protein [Ectothiorhodospira shaposhnikovii]MCG5512854.1 hypothetical protein [Ectothiorhodospira shaposhnikovii]
MNVYRNGSVVHVTIDFLNESGIPFVPTEAVYRVVDESLTEIVGETPIELAPGSTSIVVAVDGEHNELGEDAIRSIRKIEVIAKTQEQNHVLLSEMYLIASANLLVPGKNSFQTYEQALMTAMDMPEMVGWEASSRDQRVGAMVEAHHRIGALKFSVAFDDWQSRLTTSGYIADVRELTEAELAALSVRFLQAIRKAQVAEANVILGGDPVADRRREGLMVDTVGESKTMFRHGKPIQLPVSSHALRYLSGYISMTVGIGRR